MMTDEQTSGVTEEFVDILWLRGKFAALRLIRSAFIAAAAMALCALQQHTAYPVWVVGGVTLALGALNKLSWLAVVILCWFLALFLITPDLAGSFKAPRWW